MAKHEIRPVRIESNVAYVPLTKGHEAKIDAADAPAVSEHCWFAVVAKHRNGNTRTVYAGRLQFTSGKRRMVFLHRFLANPSGDMQVDHIDSDGLNNCRCNLRLATHMENARNRRTSYNNTSGVKGVCCDRGKWRVDIRTGGKRRFIGRFNTIEEAAAAYAEAAVAYHGAFARAA